MLMGPWKNDADQYLPPDEIWWFKGMKPQNNLGNKKAETFCVSFSEMPSHAF